MKQPKKLTRVQKILLTSIQKKNGIKFDPMCKDQENLLAHSLVHIDQGKLKAKSLQVAE